MEINIIEIDMKMAAIDTNSLIFLYEATDGNYDPSRDGSPEVVERLATFRIFMYTKSLRRTPSATNEILSNKQKVFCFVHVPSAGNIEPEELTKLTNEYKKYHAKAAKVSKDCKILAEAVVSKCDYLLTYDRSFKKHLNGKCGLEILLPSEFWIKLNIPKNSNFILGPNWDNPKVTKSWYYW